MQSPKSVPLIENYRRMVAQAAWRAWRALPKSIQTWISVEDMIEDGMFFAYRFAVKRFDSKRATFSTGFYHAIHNFFIREYIEMYGADKRGWVKIEGKRRSINFKSINSMIDRNGEEKCIEEIVIGIPALQIPADLTLQNALVECFTVPSLLKIHSDASPVLKDSMVEWFIHRRTKVHKKSGKFLKLATEFRELCVANNIYCDDCLHLMRSPKCMDSFSRQLLGVPFDINNPCPSVDKIIW